MNKHDYSALIEVTQQPLLWDGHDPVRPELSSEFKTSNGRKVFGLRLDGGVFAAFLCLAFTSDVPKTVGELTSLSSESQEVAVPYSVWSMKRGAGRKIVKMVAEYVSQETKAKRLVTLSPKTGMAERFHLKNGASEVGRSDSSVNFEYPLNIKA